MLFLSPTGMQLLQEANPGDLADSTSVCVSLEATYPLARSVSLTLELGGGSAGMSLTITGCWYGLM